MEMKSESIRPKLALIEESILSLYENLIVKKHKSLDRARELRYVYPT